MALPQVGQALWNVLQYGALAFLLYLIQQSFLGNPNQLNQRLRSPLAPPVPSAAPSLPPAPAAAGGKSKKKKGKGSKGGQDDAVVQPAAEEPEQVSLTRQQLPSTLLVAAHCCRMSAPHMLCLQQQWQRCCRALHTQRRLRPVQQLVCMHASQPIPAHPHTPHMHAHFCASHTHPPSSLPSFSPPFKRLMKQQTRR
jgi:hypothetical protein